MINKIECSSSKLLTKITDDCDKNKEAKSYNFQSKLTLIIIYEAIYIFDA